MFNDACCPFSIRYVLILFLTFFTAFSTNLFLCWCPGGDVMCLIPVLCKKYSNFDDVKLVPLSDTKVLHKPCVEKIKFFYGFLSSKCILPAILYTNLFKPKGVFLLLTHIHQREPLSKVFLPQATVLARASISLSIPGQNINDLALASILDALKCPSCNRSSMFFFSTFGMMILLPHSSKPSSYSSSSFLRQYPAR